MEIKNEETARRWLASWSGKPGRGYLLAAIDGMKLAISVSDSKRQTQAAAGYRAALDVIAENFRQRFEAAA